MQKEERLVNKATSRKPQKERDGQRKPDMDEILLINTKIRQKERGLVLSMVRNNPNSQDLKRINKLIRSTSSTEKITQAHTRNSISMNKALEIIQKLKDAQISLKASLNFNSQSKFPAYPRPPTEMNRPNFSSINHSTITNNPIRRSQNHSILVPSLDNSELAFSEFEDFMSADDPEKDNKLRYKISVIKDKTSSHKFMGDFMDKINNNFDLLNTLFGVSKKVFKAMEPQRYEEIGAGFQLDFYKSIIKQLGNYPRKTVLSRRTLMACKDKDNYLSLLSGVGLVLVKDGQVVVDKDMKDGINELGFAYNSIYVREPQGSDSYYFCYKSGLYCIGGWAGAEVLKIVDFQTEMRIQSPYRYFTRLGTAKGWIVYFLSRKMIQSVYTSRS